MAITWNKKPGSVAKLTSNGSNSGIYAVSADDRFHVWVRRWRTGGKGRRFYRYLFEVVDRATPSNGQTWSDVSLPPAETSEPTKVLAAVERYAAEHPV